MACAFIGAAAMKVSEMERQGNDGNEFGSASALAMPWRKREGSFSRCSNGATRVYRLYSG